MYYYLFKHISNENALHSIFYHYLLILKDIDRGIPVHTVVLR